MAKSKDYKAGGAKKGLILVGVLVLIAIIIVGVIMFWPANTYSMIEALEQNEQHFFLTEEQEKNYFDDFTTKLKARSELSYYVIEIDNVEKLTQSMKDVLSFYNDYMIYAQQNRALSSNAKVINKYIAQANSSQKSIDSILSEAKELDEEAVSYLKDSWIDFRKAFTNYMENYFKMFTALSNCYENCFDNSYDKNEASKKILNAANDYLYVIVKEYKDITMKDKKDSLAKGAYLYISNTKVQCFKLFTEDYIADKSEILEYYYTPEIQEKYSSLSNFFTVYKELDFKNMIKAINGSGIANNYTDITDVHGLFGVAKKFLDRRD